MIYSVVIFVINYCQQTHDMFCCHLSLVWLQVAWWSPRSTCIGINHWDHHCDHRHDQTFCTMIIIITIVIIMYLDGNERSVVVAASVGEIGGGKTWDGRESKLLHFIRHIQAQYNYRGNKT